MAETDLVYQILELLALHGVTAWRQNTGGRTDTNADGTERYTAIGVPGASDIFGVLPGSGSGSKAGRFLAIEVKLPGNKPSTKQWEFMLRVQKAGGVAFWVDSLEQVQRALPHLLAGAWVATDFDHRQEITDEWTTSQRLGPPAKKTRRASRSRRGSKAPSQQQTACATPKGMAKPTAGRSGR